MEEHQTNENLSAYKAMARFYDTMMGSGKYAGWQKLISDVVQKYGIPIGKCLDVACGTGNISRLLVDLGFKVVGVDMSEDMVAVARDKFPADTFVCSDVRTFELGKETMTGITFAVSFYDSLNYLLSDSDMLQCFQAVHRNIPSGTIFLFDMNTVEHVQTAQQYKPRILEEADFYSVYRFSGEGRLWVLDIDIFIKEGGGYRLVKEKHIERGYDQEHIRPLLQKAGFDILEVREERKRYEDGKEHLSRLYFIVRKP